MLQYALLWLFHLFLAFKRFVSTLLPRRRPRPLHARRRKLPGHLAVLLRHGEPHEGATSELLETLESVRRLAVWCRMAGIRVLSVYDEKGQLNWSRLPPSVLICTPLPGLLLNAWEQVYEILQENNSVDVSVSGDNKVTHSVTPDVHLSQRRLHVPLTPPLSKSSSFSSTRSSSPEPPSYRETISERGNSNEMKPQIVTFTLKNSRTDESSRKRQPIISSVPLTSPGPLTIYLLSKMSGKPQIARVTRNLARSALSQRTWGYPPGKMLDSTPSINPSTLSSLLQGTLHICRLDVAFILYRPRACRRVAMP